MSWLGLIGVAAELILMPEVHGQQVILVGKVATHLPSCLKVGK